MYPTLYYIYSSKTLWYCLCVNEFIIDIILYFRVVYLEITFVCYSGSFQTIFDNQLYIYIKSKDQYSLRRSLKALTLTGLRKQFPWNIVLRLIFYKFQPEGKLFSRWLNGETINITIAITTRLHTATVLSTQI